MLISLPSDVWKFIYGVIEDERGRLMKAPEFEARHEDIELLERTLKDLKEQGVSS